MNGKQTAHSRKLLVVEPRVEGHHPGWLKFITEDLLSAGYELSLAVDLRPQSRPIIEEHLGDLMMQVELLRAVDERGRPLHGSTAACIVAALEASGASRAFLCAFDELASAAFRRAAIGLNPPLALRGRMGGIYHRPRFTDAPWWSPNRLLKVVGFHKFMRANWIRPLLLLDEYLTRDFQRTFPDRPIHFLPDPCPDDFDGDPALARAELGIPPHATVFLFFGVGARRKGLHLAVEAMLRLEQPDTLLLVAGRQNPPPRVREGLDQLERQQRALILDRYVSSAVEKRCFQAADVVLLPYLNHFGTSGILSRAMATGKPVIASDEQLLGKLVRDNEIGWCFPSGNVAALAGYLARAAAIDDGARRRFTVNASAYANRYSRKRYREALLKSLAST
jgi:glycosyltransferase involved in cell wall biosynthesis